MRKDGVGVVFVLGGVEEIDECCVATREVT